MAARQRLRFVHEPPAPVVVDLSAALAHGLGRSPATRITDVHVSRQQVRVGLCPDQATVPATVGVLVCNTGYNDIAVEKPDGQWVGLARGESIGLALGKRVALRLAGEAGGEREASNLWRYTGGE